MHSSKSSGGGQRGRVLQRVTAIALRFKSNGHKAYMATAATLHLMLDLPAILAIEMMCKLNLVALSRAEEDARIGAVAVNSSDVHAVLPHALVAAMKATHRFLKQQTQEKPRTSSVAASSAVKARQDQAQGIDTFAGMNPMRLHASLVQLEALIN